MTRRLLLAALTLSMCLVSLVGPAAAAEHTKTDVTVKSKAADGINIVISVYRPATAGAETPVPVILHSHGWGGSRTSGATSFRTELDAGFGVVSIDQRGHGASGGKAHVENPDFEGQDIISVVDYVTSLDWVARNRDANGAIVAVDPVLFAMGGSYGGGYQFVGAFTELRDMGWTRFDALAPEITWFNLAESLAPSKVVRTAWTSALYAAGATKLADHIHPAFAFGASTGQWPDGTVPALANLEAEFFNNGPSGHVAKGRTLDIPMLVGQGINDNLFNLNQGWKNFELALTPQARARSLFVGYHGGHVLPNALPLATSGSGDVCSGPGGFGALRMRFFQAVVAGQDTSALLPAPYNLAMTGNECVRLQRLDQRKAYPIGVDITVARGTVTTSGVGAPQHHQIAAGPLTIAGIPTVSTEVSTAGADQRVFFAISVGDSPATAQVVQNNMMPLRELLPAIQQKRTIELPGIAVKVPAGQFAYLTVSPVSDMFAGHGSTRTPGLVGLDDLVVNLPVVN